MENRENMPPLSESHFLRDAIEADTARKEHSEWISKNADRLISEHGSYNTIKFSDGGGRAESRHYATKFDENWNIGVYAVRNDKLGRREGIHLNLTEHNEANEVTRTIILAKVSLSRQEVTDGSGNDLSIADLREIDATLEQLLHDAKELIYPVYT